MGFIIIVTVHRIGGLDIVREQKGRIRAGVEIVIGKEMFVL